MTNLNCLSLAVAIYSGVTAHASDRLFPSQSEVQPSTVWKIPGPSDVASPDEGSVADDPALLAYQRFVRAAWGFELTSLNCYADRVMRICTPDQQFASFALVLRSTAWSDAVLGDGSRFEAALELLDRGLAIRERVLDGSEEYDSLALDPLIAKLDEALGNAMLTIQKARSGIHRPGITAAFAQLRAARPWYWWDDRSEEIAAAQRVIPALRDRLLVDISTEARLNQFQEELRCPGRTDLDVAAGQDLVSPRGANRIHGNTSGRLIAHKDRVFDASHAQLLETIGPAAGDSNVLIIGAIPNSTIVGRDGAGSSQQ